MGEGTGLTGKGKEEKGSTRSLKSRRSRVGNQATARGDPCPLNLGLGGQAGQEYRHVSPALDATRRDLCCEDAAGSVLDECATWCDVM